MIDYEKSIQKITSPKFILLYIANMGMVCNIDKITPELMSEYMKLNEFSDIANLHHTHANILHLAKYGEMLSDDVDWAWTIDECIDFAQVNHSILIPQLAFINSMPLYLLTHMSAEGNNINKRNYDTIVSLQTNERIDEIGYSVIKLLTLSGFLLSMLRTNIPLSHQIYFTSYFDECIFNGNSLFAYMFDGNNEYTGLVVLITEAVSENGEDAMATLSSLMHNMQQLVHSQQTT